MRALTLKKGFNVLFSCLLVLSGFTLFFSVKDVGMAAEGDYKVVGYYTSWGPPQNLDPNKLTHLNFAFADVCWDGQHGNPEVWVPEGEDNVWPCTDLAGNEAEVPNGSVVLGDPEVDLAGLQNVQALKGQNPNLKTLISVGGWSWSNNISLAARTEETRQHFADSAVEYVRTFDMDGVDLDWEYPVEGGMWNNERDPSDKQNHTLLLQAIRDALDVAEQEDGKEYLLTIASSVSFTYVENNELDKIANIVDFINIMAYDFNGTWSETSAHNAPLYHDAQAEDAGVHPYHIEQAVQGHLNAGVPNNKLVVGVPFYGRAWGNCNADTDGEMTDKNGGYQLCDGNGGGDLEPGVYSYHYIINELLNKNGFKYYWNDHAKVPYLYNDDIGEFVTFDNVESIQHKVKFIKESGLAGAMIWELSQDGPDANLLKAVSHDLGISSEAPTPEPEEPEDGDKGENGEDNENGNGEDGGDGEENGDDDVAPVITLNGDNPMELEVGDTYEEPGATAEDEVDGDVTHTIEIAGEVNTEEVGTYEVVYTVSDAAGNVATATRVVHVVEDRTEEVPGENEDEVAPNITLNGDNPMELEVGDTYEEPGATAEDEVDGDVTDAIEISGEVNAEKVGTYEIVYTVSDAAGNVATATRVVHVVEAHIGKDSGENEKAKEEENDKDKAEVAVEKVEVEGGNKLPVTATNIFQLLGIGFVVIIVGACIMYIQRRKQKVE